MKESEFINQNKEKWANFESIISKKMSDPEELSRVFIQVTDDLSHSRSFYNNRSVRVYLNSLAQAIFNKLNRRKKISIEGGKEFFLKTIPQLMYEARKDMLVSFLVFILSMAIGIYSSIKNPNFAELVLGEQYVEMTKKNIDNNDPMAVYRGGKGIDGFFSILINNARIDIMLLGLGMLFGFGAILVLIRNGIMVGVFQYFFFAHGGFKDSLLTIWLHGTIEITTIILIGGIGILAGRGWLFPKTYTRIESFKTTAKQAGLLTLGILPFTFIAAVIEGFITRQTGAPDFVKILLILASLGFVVIYFVWYPFVVVKKEGVYKVLKSDSKVVLTSVNKIKSAGQSIISSFSLIGNRIGPILTTAFFGSIGYILISKWMYPSFLEQQKISNLITYYLQLINGFDYIAPPILVKAPPPFFVIGQSAFFSIICAILYIIVRNIFYNREPKRKLLLFLGVFLIFLPSSYLYFDDNNSFLPLVSFFAFSLSVFYLEFFNRPNATIASKVNFGRLFSKAFFGLLGLSLIAFFLLLIVLNLVDAQVLSLFYSIIIDFIPEGLVAEEMLKLYWSNLFKNIAIFMCLAITMASIVYYYHSSVEKIYSLRLKDDLERINPEYYAKLKMKLDEA